jgi:hypothetical protein
MPRRATGSLAIVSLLASACFVPQDARPTVALSTQLATRFVHRGMTLVDNPVVQPRLAVQLPTETDGDGRLGLTAEASMDLRNNTGGAWFPDGHAGRFTQIEMIADYQRTFGDVTVRAGLHNYNLPNGLEFPNGERGGTSEVFAVASTEFLDATPYVAWHYDFDEVRGAYYRAGVTEGFELGENLTLRLDGSLGYAGSAQSAWLYGIDESGLADLRGSAIVTWQYDARTQISVGAHGSMIVDSAIDRWFRDIAPQGVDDDPIWFTIGIGWVF